MALILWVSWITASFFWIISLFLLIYTISNWKNPKKMQERYSEIVEVFLFVIMGYYILKLIPITSKNYQLFYWILFGTFSFFFIFFFGFNVFPNFIKAFIVDGYRNHISYEKFIIEMKEIYNSEENSSKTADRIKDFTRKILHFIQFIGIIFIHELTLGLENTIIQWGITPIIFRNFILLILAGPFWIMMIVGDLTRLTHWKYLPKWAWKWYSKSLEVNKEEWTLNAAIPIVLSNFIWMNPIFPIQVFFTAAWVSCISDGLTSIIGKHFGKNFIRKLGNDSRKTYEGLISGILSTFVGVIGIFYFYPVYNLPLIFILLLALLCSVLFALVDLYSFYLCDNLSNGLFTGFVTWVFLIFFI